MWAYWPFGPIRSRKLRTSPMLTLLKYSRSQSVIDKYAFFAFSSRMSTMNFFPIIPETSSGKKVHSMNNSDKYLCSHISREVRHDWRARRPCAVILPWWIVTSRTESTPENTTNLPSHNELNDYDYNSPRSRNGSCSQSSFNIDGIPFPKQQCL